MSHQLTLIILLVVLIVVVCGYFTIAYPNQLKENFLQLFSKNKQNTPNTFYTPSRRQQNGGTVSSVLSKENKHVNFNLQGGTDTIGTVDLKTNNTNEIDDAMDTNQMNFANNSKQINYANYQSRQGGAPFELLEQNEDLLAQGPQEVTPMTDMDQQYAPVAGIETNKQLSPSELFNSNQMKPQQTTINNKGWSTPTVITNNDLIVPTRCFGIDTIGTSNRNASWDLRGQVGCETTFDSPSPWLNSTIAPNPIPNGLGMNKF
jgi:hypothetical protein